jgi:hypothetical protein
MGRAPLDLAAPEIADRLDLPVEVIDGWIDRRLLPSNRSADGVRRVTRRNVALVENARATDDRGNEWTPADFEVVLERLGPVLRDPTSLRPSLLGRLFETLLEALPWIMPGRR